MVYEQYLKNCGSEFNQILQKGQPKLESVLHTNFGPDDQGQGHNQVSWIKICFGSYFKATEVDSIKLLLKL